MTIVLDLHGGYHMYPCHRILLKILVTNRWGVCRRQLLPFQSSLSSVYRSTSSVHSNILEAYRSGSSLTCLLLRRTSSKVDHKSISTSHQSVRTSWHPTGVLHQSIGVSDLIIGAPRLSIPGVSKKCIQS